MENIDKINQIKLITGEDVSSIEHKFKSEFVDAPHISRLSEKEFRNFVPFFTGQANIFEREDVLEDWITIAGSRYMPVEVYDPTGATIFTVPGLFTTSSVNLTEQSSSTIKDIMHGYEQRSGLPPMVGTTYMLNELYNKSEDLDKNLTLDREASEMWDVIFKYYGVQVTPVDTVSIVEDDFLIDD
jgi:hypothetical protein